MTYRNAKSLKKNLQTFEVIKKTKNRDGFYYTKMKQWLATYLQGDLAISIKM